MRDKTSQSRKAFNINPKQEYRKPKQISKPERANFGITVPLPEKLHVEQV
jgi:hypothetical protein